MSFEELDESCIVKACVVVSKIVGWVHFGSPCPPGFVSFYRDESTGNLYKQIRGEIFGIDEDGVKIRALYPGYKRGGARKKNMQLAVILDDQCNVGSEQ